MPDSSPILALPYLQASQAQKHVTHNEALQRLDLLVQMRVAGFDAQTPPDLPQEGELHALGAGPIGVWAGQGGKIAAFLDDGWSFLDPRPGWRAWGIAESELRLFDGSAWTRIMGVSDNLEGIGVNTGADAVNRLSVSAQATLLSHEGAGHQLKVNKAAPGETASLLFQSDWTGHAEMGLAGDTDFSVKVSIDGTTWTEALRIDAANGLASGAAVQDGPTDTTPGRLMRADHGFSRGNILGSVAQSGGIPTGAVFERGSNSGGNYVRFADGTQICWKSDFLLDDNDKFGGFGLKKIWTFPALFAAMPMVVSSLNVNKGTFTPHRVSGITEPRPGYRPAGHNYVEMIIISTGAAFAAADTAYCDITAIGRWY